MISRRGAARAGFGLSEYGLGARALGGRRYGRADERTAIAVCEACVEPGGNLIDAARGALAHDLDRAGPGSRQPLKARSVW